MATRKTTTKKSAKNTNQTAAKRRTAKKSAVQPALTLQAADLQTQKAASVEQQLATPIDSTLGTVVQQRVGLVEQAMAQRAGDLSQMQAEAARAEQAQAQEHRINAGVAPAGVASTPRVPVAPDKDPAGIHPDVTSPTTAVPGEVRVPGTGVADPRDLAPGQDLTPSPPMSSSNILPTPNKPGSLYAKL